MRSMTSEEGESGTVIHGKELYELEVRVHSSYPLHTNTILCLKYFYICKTYSIVQAVRCTLSALLTLLLEYVGPESFPYFIHGIQQINYLSLFLSHSWHVRAGQTLTWAGQGYSGTTAIAKCCKSHMLQI